MTLLITAANRHNIYQSADFRLTNSITRQVIADSSTKLISIYFPKWHGFITYTGIGGWKGRDTSEWVVDWLRDVDADAPNVIEALLVDRATKWVGSIAQQLRYTPQHTFVLSAFDLNGARISVISNFEDVVGREKATPSSTFAGSTVRPRGKAKVVVCGAKESVVRADRKALANLLDRASPDTARMRRELAAVNARAAQAPKSYGTISSNCSVVWSRADGRGAIDMEGKVEVRTVSFGMPSPTRTELSKMLGFEVGAVGGVTMASGRSGPAFWSCAPVSAGNHDRYRIEEIKIPDLITLGAVAINDLGVIAGSGRMADAVHDRPWRTDQSGNLILAEFEGRSLAIDSRGVVGGLGIDDSNAEVAVLWHDQAVRELKGGRGRSSHVTALSRLGLAVGWVSTGPEALGQATHRPAAWLDEDAPVILEDLGGGWGGCVGITDDAVALVMIYREHRASTHLWHLRSGKFEEVGGGGQVFPEAISSTGRVLGNIGEYCVVADPGGPWRNLFDGPGYHGTAMSDAGDIVGRRKDGYGKPWLRLASGEFIHLPYLKDHWTTPRALNAAGWIVGEAASDHGAHAVIWRPV